MTLQLRPTFSESWYRVKNLRAKLRPGAQISRQYYRGDRWYVVRDPAGNQFHRLSDPAYRFVGLLDGSRTIEEAWDLCGGQLEDDAPTQPEVIQILSHLFSANLIDADVTPDATVLLRRHKQQQKRKMQGRMMNVLFPRIPLWDPDRFLLRWMPLVRIMFSKLGALVWLVTVISAITVVASKTQTSPVHDLKAAAMYAVNLHTNTINVALLWFMFVFIKLIHELGHAFSCRRFGGECHELGIMFLVFVPTPYVDASSAWSFPNKWHRVFVGAGGMIVELFFASLCAFIWVNVDPKGLLGQLMFNAMLVASVTTLIFNANPLLRYDGYYILSDFLEIPNLRQKSAEYSLGLIKRHLFRVRLQQPLPPPLQRFWLFTYSIASGIYRTFVGIMIIMLVAFQIPVLGILMSIGGVVTWVAVPVFKTFKYLTIEPELHRKRGRATAYTLAFVGACVVLIGFIRFPLNLDALGIAAPAVQDMVKAQSAGFVSRIVAQDGQWVEGPVYQADASGNILKDPDGRPLVSKPGQVLMVLQSKEIDAKIEASQAQINALERQRDKAIQEAAADVGIIEESIGAVGKELRELIEQRDLLTIRATMNGWLVAPQLDEMNGKHLAPGDPVAMITLDDKLLINTLVPQKDFEPVRDEASRKALRTEVRFAGDVSAIHPGGAAVFLGEATPSGFDPSLTTAGGTDIAPSREDPKKTEEPQFKVGVYIPNPGGRYVAGQRAHVRFELDHKPLYWQWSRRFWQLIQSQHSQWM